MRLASEASVRKAVTREVGRVPVVDMHTHLFEPRFGKLLLWGVDELVTYHYLIAELFRARADLPPAAFWKLSKRRQADLIWKALFVERAPVSEACRGVVTCLKALGIKPGPGALERARRFCARRGPESYVDTVFKLAGVTSAVMTNNPFDDEERPLWDKGGKRDGRFIPALRIDALLRDWPAAARKLRAMGYSTGTGARGPDAGSARQVRRFLADWKRKLRPAYMAASLPPEFDYPAGDACTAVLDRCLLPFAEESKLPLALMIGARLGVNPELRLAGDGVGRSRVEAVENLCRKWPGVRFLVTILARENQHQLCVSARKFANLMPFGCWWFLNDPSIIEMITAQRLELLGTGVVPQHSDARVLDQLIYKWRHSREVIGEVLADKFAALFRAGWPVSGQEVRREVERLFSGNFLEFVGR
jgi:hypothetical protein